MFVFLFCDLLGDFQNIFAPSIKNIFGHIVW
jgi:hypothetical protein